jgi:hypothetical protein
MTKTRLTASGDTPGDWTVKAPDALSDTPLILMPLNIYLIVLVGNAFPRACTLQTLKIQAQ